MLRRFRLEEPDSVTQVSELLGRFGDNAKIYAGGTELLLAMKEGLVRYERLINVKGVKGLSDVVVDNGTVRIGALCTHRQVETSSMLQQKLPALVKLEQMSPMFECGKRVLSAAIFALPSPTPILARC